MPELRLLLVESFNCAPQRLFLYNMTLDSIWIGHPCVRASNRISFLWYTLWYIFSKSPLIYLGKSQNLPTDKTQNSGFFCWQISIIKLRQVEMDKCRAVFLNLFWFAAPFLGYITIWRHPWLHYPSLETLSSEIRNIAFPRYPGPGWLV